MKKGFLNYLVNPIGKRTTSIVPKEGKMIKI
jgi:hypothetical protein